MKITKHYPGFVNTVNADNPESGEFKTKKELLNIPFIKEWMSGDWKDDNHLEVVFFKNITTGDISAHLMEVSNDLHSCWVIGIITKSSDDDEDVKIMKNWFPKWDFSKMKPIKEFKEVKVEF